MDSRRDIEILGYQSFEVLKDYMQRAKAFVFAAEEDFGIIPVEAQACGTPVIAYGNGGVLETVIPLNKTGVRSQESGVGRQESEGSPTGVFFDEQTPGALMEAVNKFEKNQDTFDCNEIRKNAERFSKERFKREFKSFVDTKITEFFS
ncbi:MAG TPA: glycosyltransferase [Candidatus Moranbacteria bacterium]|nr:glycosyltransferase [Candidatus Moranbacteria bacterium]